MKVYDKKKYGPLTFFSILIIFYWRSYNQLLISFVGYFSE